MFFKMLFRHFSGFAKPDDSRYILRTGAVFALLRTAVQITDAFREIWPADPCLGDFALFGYGINK